VESAEARGEDRRIGVLYLDSREKGTLLSASTRAGLETLAAEASVAIENARLYREKLEKAKMEQEMKIAAEIQQALLPKPRASLGFVEAHAASIPCRSIGGDFFDYVDEPNAAFGFTLGDVAGKGPPAALMSALMQGMFASHAILSEGPAAAVTVMNRALCRRGLESRFVTLMFGVVTPDGEMTYCNAGHNPPMVIGPNGVKRLDVGGPVVGLLEFAPYDQETVRLEPGDTIVIFSDGVSEALNSNGDEFGDDRLQAVVEPARKLPASEIVDRLVAAVREFTRGAPQSDDITAMAVRYLGNAR
jgi:sigma-B regulation protein RsbU (phosphoserine phosphatase)